MTERDAEGDNLAIIAPTGLEFRITDTKLFVPVVSLSKENDIRWNIKWNKYRPQMTIKPPNDKLNYLIVPTFTIANRLFVLSFSRNNEDDSRDSFSHYYVPNAKIKDFNV